MCDFVWEPGGRYRGLGRRLATTCCFPWRRNVRIDHPTWIDPRIEIRESPLHGRGAFAVAPIQAGEVVTIWAHTVIEPSDFATSEGGELHQRADGSYVWLPESWMELDGYDPAEDRLNHSCDPNVWMLDEVTLVARRDIAAGEELMGDYALWELDLDWVCPWECRCGSPDCRGSVTGSDWELPSLQRRYRGHFHPVLERRIAAQSERHE